MKKVLLNFVKQYFLSLLAVTVIGTALLAYLTLTLIGNQTAQCTDRTYTVISSTQNITVNTCAVPNLLSRFSLEALPAFILVFALFFVFLLIYGAKSQIIHRRQWSWFRIFIYIFFLALLFAATRNVNLLYKKILLAIALLVGLVLLALFITFKVKRNNLLNKTFGFANGTIGRGDDDILGFTPAADNFLRGLLHLHLPVQVIAITGGMGSGKSTFWRITAEGMNKNVTMHTYISLTETNSSTDFTKLFAKRWFATLKQRYAILLSPDYIEQSRLFNVLRDGSHGFLSDLVEMFLAINIGLFRTKSKIVDNASEAKSSLYVGKDTAELFNNIPEVYENQWYIVIDELERSPIEEVYRVIEVIERFKQLGKNGLPVQIIFVLCYDVDYFETFKNRLPDTNSWAEKTRLVQNFLTNNNRKSIDIIQRVPRTSTNSRIQLITDKIKLALSVLPKQAFDMSKYRLLDGLYDTSKNDFLDITPQLTKYSKDLSSKELFDFLVLRMIDLPPRSTVRLVAQLRFDISAVGKKAQEEWLLNTGLSTFLGMEYMRVIRPELWQFIENSYLRFDPDLNSFYTMFNHWTVDKDNDKRTEREKIYENTGIDTTIYSDQELKSIIEDLNILVPVVAKFMFSGEDPYENNVTQYNGTLSDPDNLRWIIEFNYGKQTNFGKYAQLYLQVKQLKWPSELSSPEIIKDFSSFVRGRIGYSDKTKEASLFIARNIFEYIETHKNSFEASSTDFAQNDIDKLTYEFIFQLQEAIYGHEAAEDIQIEGTQLFDSFIHSSNVPYEAKLITIDAFLNESGSGFERVRTREEIFEKYKGGKSYFPQLFEEMLDSMISRYGKKGSSINIYNHEANFFYVLYQSWDGDPNSVSLPRLREVANKGLTSNAKGLQALWAAYPYAAGLKTYQDFIGRIRDFPPFEMPPSRRGMFVSLERLLHFSKVNQKFRKLLQNDEFLRDKVQYWHNVFNEGTYTKEELELQPVNDIVGAKIRNLTRPNRASTNIQEVSPEEPLN